jgi:hypothetical protein
MNHALSNSEISKLFNGRVSILRYKDLAYFPTIDKLLSPFNKVFILYESKPGYGHWTLLHKLNKGNVEMFDSYGMKIDGELDYIPREYREESTQAKAYLSRLLANSKYTIHYNDHPLQDTKKGISTCGRWCVLRAINKQMSIDTFANKVKEESNAKGISPDELVCELVRI